jgi:AcrR family transcriptional regulator
MRGAQLTHGGFYGHFKSRDALLSEALTRAGSDSLKKLRRQIASWTETGGSPVRGLLEGYLSMEHVLDYDNGCPVPLLSSDMFRQKALVVERSQMLVEDLHGLVTEILGERSYLVGTWLLTSALLGAVQLARIVARKDIEGAGALLAQTKERLLAQYDGVPTVGERHCDN